MNVAQAKVLVKRYGFDDSDPIVDWLNEAQNNFYDAFDWPWFKVGLSNTLVLGSPSLPSNITAESVPRTLQIQVGTRMVTLSYKSLNEFLNECRDDTVYGQPYCWTFVNPDGVRVYPVPDAGYPYTLYYTIPFTPVVTDADTFAPWPTRYHYTIVRGAAAIGLDVDNQEERAATQSQKFDNAVDKAIMKYRSEQTGRIDRVRNTAGY